MTAPQVADEFLYLLSHSKLLAQEEIDKAIVRYGLRDKTPVEVAKSLIQHGILTRFQAERLLKGKRRGLVIDGYKLLFVLGQGGMGVVYCAEEIKTGWKVALKVLSQKYRHDPGMFARFQLEAQAGLRLAHPNILRTLAIGRTEDVYGEIHYVVMEMVQGVTLPELLIMKGRLPWEQACDIIAQAAKGLHYAHEAGLIHRDVKPDNLLVRSDGAVKILDFGLAMVDENDEEFSMAMIQGQDRCLGTADYIAPEQTVDSYNVDRRVDIYGLGCTFYAILSGQVPFPVSTVSQKLLCHRRKKPIPLNQIRSDVPPQLIETIEKMMAKLPDKRFSTCEQVVRLLQPMARRYPVEFDFNRVLVFRARQAAKRAGQASPRRAADSSTASDMRPEWPSSSLGSDAEPQQADRETEIRDDTKLERERPTGAVNNVPPLPGNEASRNGNGAED